MIHISKLLHGGSHPGDAARFGGAGKKNKRPPVLVWHLTGDCNLRCRHCYAAGAAQPPMARDEAFAFIDCAAEWQPASLLFSGGEPLYHPDFFAYLARARERGLNVAVSTNGTAIDDAVAARMADLGVSYAGVSLDGVGDVHDDFRGVDGAFARSCAGVRALMRAGVRVGLRTTLARAVLSSLDELMGFAAGLGVDRICFYHFVPAGRGEDAAAMVPDRAEIRAVLDSIVAWTESLKPPKKPGEVLTVGNFSDGIFLYLRLLARNDARAESVRALIERAGGNRSGRGVLSVRWDGTVFADQFSWREPLGSWRDIEKIIAANEESASDLSRIGGRCGSCRWLGLCRGNMRARAFALTGDRLAADPGCVLEDDEI